MRDLRVEKSMVEFVPLKTEVRQEAGLPYEPRMAGRPGRPEGGPSAVITNMAVMRFD